MKVNILVIIEKYFFNNLSNPKSLLKTVKDLIKITLKLASDGNPEIR